MSSLQSRTKNVKLNILWGNIGTFIVLIFSFVNRTVFLKVLSVEYLGLNGLFLNLLGILAFSELGIGSVINYALYKPIAQNEEEKIIALLKLYKKVYRIIALVVFLSGLIIFPFLKFIVNSEIPLKYVRIYFLLMLLNSVSSYFVTYKTSYVAAIQKDYINTNINTITQIITFLLQLIVLVSTKRYLYYLIVLLGVGILQKFVMILYLNCKFPILKRTTISKIDNETKESLKQNVKAQIFHQIGGVCVHQTDNIIISTFISTKVVGLISNYVMLSNMITKFTNIIFNGVNASIGNFILCENDENKKLLFETYTFVGYWIFGFVSVSFILLSQPFITLWLGQEYIIDYFTVILFFISIYLQGQSLPVHNFKVAAGIFVDDQWISFAQAIVNLVLSIIFVKMIGLPGVYIGTIVQRMIAIIVWPNLVYKKVLHAKASQYFIKLIKRTLLLIFIILFLNFVFNKIFVEITISSFICMFFMDVILVNLIIFLFVFKTKEFKYLLTKMKRRTK